MAACQPCLVPGKFAKMWGDRRYNDLHLLLAAPESMEGAEQARVRKKPRLESAQQTGPHSQQLTQAAAGADEQQTEECQTTELSSRRTKDNSKRTWDQRNRNGDNKEEGCGVGDCTDPAWERVGVAKFLLAGSSEYFRKRLEGWEADRWTTAGDDRLPALVVGVDQDLQTAAKAVLQLMYEEVVPQGLAAVELAKMCRIADMWRMGTCVSLCLTALSQVEPSSVDAEDLSRICSLLPDSLNQLPQYKAWQEQCQRIITGIIASYTDVHALVTSGAQLQQFAKLPYMVIKAWAASDDLVVDSEDSVAVALDWWIRCNYDGRHSGGGHQNEPTELVKLVRMQHVSPDRRLHWLPNRSWAKRLLEQLALLNVGLASGIPTLASLLPPAWLAPARKQSMDPVVIAWDIPLADLSNVLEDTSRNLYSPAAYMCGKGMQMHLIQSADSSSSKTTFGVFLRLSPYTPPGLDSPLCKAGLGQGCEFSIAAEVPSSGVPRVLTEGTYVVTRKGLGAVAPFTASSSSDLEKLCVGGFLRLRATVKVKSGLPTTGQQ